MPLNKDAAVAYLNAHALVSSTGKCAAFVRRAIEAGGVPLNLHPADAKAYGPTLLKAGFVAVSGKGYVPAKGDVVVIQSYTGGDSAGHIAMYNGIQWISDFKQRDIWAGPGYRKAQPAMQVYRP